MMMMDGCTGGGMLLWSILLLALVAGGVWLAVRAFRTNSSPATGGESSALHVLRDRYARGEIDDAEFEERRRILGD